MHAIDEADGNAEDALPLVALRSDNMRSRSRKNSKKFTNYVPKPRGAPGGPLRTPLHIGDSWQHQETYEVEKVILALPNKTDFPLFVLYV